MNRTLTLVAALLILATAFAISGGVAYAADRMTYEEYQIQLQALQAREQAALDAIAAEQKTIDDLRARIEQAKSDIDATWEAIFAALGITREDYEAFLAAISDLEAQVGAMARLAPDRLLERAKELDALGARVDEMATNPIARMKEPGERLQRLQARVAALKRSLPKPKNDMYTVIRGDCLWKISGKQEIYQDPWKWMRIYSANRVEIKDPDLIYPNQDLRIPRQIGRDEYLVVKGDYLAKIAGYSEVYGDPFKWTKIYQANKSGGFLQDPNLIFPEQILSIPHD